MSDQPKWMPSDEEIAVAASYLAQRHDPTFSPLRALIRAAVEKRDAEQEARHKRDLIVAQIGESTLWSATNPRLAERRIQQLRAELAALDATEPQEPGQPPPADIGPYPEGGKS